jgi:MFS family permease
LDGGVRLERDHSLWSPLRVVSFRVLGLAQLGANTGIWVHTVASQWLLTATGGSTTLVASVQTALTLPFFALALPAGLVADLLDRRRVLTLASALMALTSLSLAVATAAGPMSYPGIMSATLVLGAANVLSVICWQSLIPELVGRPRVAAAATLDGMSFNAARAAGPAIGGLVLSLFGPISVFAFDTAAFAAAGFAFWVYTPRSSSRTTEPRISSALAGGLRFVRHSRWTRRLLFRLVVFSFPASCLWALLPVVAHQRLGLDSTGFGLLFAAVGVGAVLGSVAVQPIRVRLSTNAFIAVGSGAYAVALLVVATVDQPVLVASFLFIAGASWVTVQTTWMAAAQIVLPPWVRARGLASVLLVHQGCQAFGALAWGALAEVAGLSWSIALAAATMAAGGASAVKWGLRPTAGIEPVHVSLWSEPEPVDASVGSREGPVLVLVEYDVASERLAEFLAAMTTLAGSRRRLGARRWDLYRDATRPNVFVESYVVSSWGEHVHQESARWTLAEKRVRDAAETLADRAPWTRRLVATDASNSAEHHA